MALGDTIVAPTSLSDLFTPTPGVVSPAPATGSSALSDLVNGVNSVVSTYYGTKAQIANAQAAQQIAQARNSAALQTAQVGLPAGFPSPTVLLVGGGLFLATVFLISGGRGKR